MARKRFTPERIVAILREAERGTKRKALFRKHGISEQTFYRWKRMYGGLGESEVRRIKQLEEENRKLKELVGEQAMVAQAQREVMKKKGGPEIEREIVGVLVERGMKQRRAGRHMGVSRGTVRHKRRPEDLLSWVNGRGKVRRGVGRRDQDSDVEWDKSTRTTGLFRCLFLPLESWNECADEKDGSSGITQLQEYSTDIQPL